MLKPKVWFDALRVRWALKMYPVYSPPNMRNEIELPIGMAKENFNYLQTNLASRQTSFRSNYSPRVGWSRAGCLAGG
jgi:hypothetical protein